MNLHLSCLLFFLVTSLPAGYCIIGNNGVSFRTCTAVNGTCFFGCKLGWIWIGQCNNIMSCCKRDTLYTLPQTKGI
ncbi:beta-defensin 136 [Grammomys surdaster]|uniref:beta-defensin 136 n=1 Tax=Grammomys surdaster TaxID=491861 RepID=UPI0010A05F5C|nr:beta-defensin 136 [Grammomys surdaster]